MISVRFFKKILDSQGEHFGQSGQILEKSDLQARVQSGKKSQEAIRTKTSFSGSGCFE
jgi:hypothetical protein